MWLASDEGDPKPAPPWPGVMGGRLPPPKEALSAYPPGRLQYRRERRLDVVTPGSSRRVVGDN